MSTSTDHKAAALAAIQSLRNLAVHGDAEAACALLEVATTATRHVGTLSKHPADRTAPATLRRVAADAWGWPVMVPAMVEDRATAILGAIPATLGQSLPARANGNARGRKRDFHPESRTGFTLGIMQDLMAAGDFPWCGDADDITLAALEQLDADTGGDWETFPLPAGLVADAEREAHRGNPRRAMAERWIRDGLKSLLP